MDASTICYGLTHCDTVKRARAWLDATGQAYRFHDFRKSGVPADRLDAWIAALGWERLVNRQGLTWRKLDEATRASVTDIASARALMLATCRFARSPSGGGPGQRPGPGLQETASCASAAASSRWNWCTPRSWRGA
jgi:arsenate reductase-like glutaredoxin family protein